MANSLPKRCLPQNTVKTPMIWKKRGNVASDSLSHESSLQTDKVCFLAELFVVTSQTGSQLTRIPTRHSSPSKIFSSKVSSSPTRSRPAFLLSFARHQSDNFPQQTKLFFPYFLHNSRLSLSWNCSSKYSIDPTVFNFTTNYGEAVLKSNNDKLGNILKFCHWHYSDIDPLILA